MSAVEAAEDSLAGLIEHVPSRDVSAVESMRVALDLGLGVYDSSYLVLSRATEQPLITADRSLFDIGLRAGHDMVWLGDLAID